MNTGQIISGAGHIGLIGWALFGNVLASDPIPFEVTEVTAISEEEFAAIMAAERPPEAISDVFAPQVPDAPDDAPDLSSAADAAPDPAAPDAAQSADPDAAPALTETTPPADAELTDEAPVLQPPEPQDFAALVPETSLRPKPRPADRVAPEPVAPPAPDTAIDDIVREETQPDEAADTPAPEQEATAPEEAATEIVTEAEQAAPSRSVRPKARPNRETPPAPQVADTAPEADTSSVNAALAAALGEAAAEPATPAAPSVPSGPPLNAGEKDALRVAVSRCWNTGSLSSEALGTTVVLKVEMTEAAKPIISSIRLVSATGGSSGAANQAFAAARRAIIRCGSSGFDLPAEKYAAWRDIEMTFNPEKMRIK